MIAAKAETCAVVLIVKDEVTDIACWLAWYHLLGCDTLIVFDDGSTDGTWELLEQAAKAQDIRLFRAQGPADQRYQVRQRASYEYAIANFGAAYDWLAFFDADEFLLLNQDEDVKTFLAKFPDADAVAVNWCHYGSSGHVLKPDLLPIEAYTWHAAADGPINRHVKSFVRPKALRGSWVNVHAFDIDPARYALANGRLVNWSATPGIIGENPDWGVAKLMHYQCRSMEHFIERMKKRRELASRENIWAGYDVKEVQDTAPLRLIESVKRQMARYRPALPETGLFGPDPAD